MGDIRWPDGKKCAVMFTFDVDGDTTWENGNRGLKNGEKYIKSLSVGQYGPKRCVDRILQKLDQYGVKATFFVPGLTAERYPEVIKRIAEQGHEIGHHGYAHERFAGKTTEEQIEIIEKTQKIFKDLIGHEVTGFRTPSGDWAKNTPKLLYERGFRYSSSMRGDDRPYRTVIDGEETDFIEIPTKWEVDDYVAMAYHMYPAEPAGQAVLSSLGLKAAIQAGMCLGEGTGAAAFFPMLDMALTIYSKMDTFQDIQVKPYCHFEEDKNEDKE